MKMPEQGSVPSLLLALAGAIAPAVVKALIERRSRSSIKEERVEMCRNHSHVAGKLLSAYNSGEYFVVKMRVEQPLTLEISPGTKLTLPPNTVLSVRQDMPTASSDLPLPPMGELGVADLFRVAKATTSGHTTRPK